MPRLPRTVRIVAVGKLRERHWRDAQTLYHTRLTHYVQFQIVEVKDVRGRRLSETQHMRLEGERLLATTRDDEHKILLTETGTHMTSQQFAAYLEKWLTVAHKNMAFIVGGPLGCAPEVEDVCNDHLALSAMTFPHEMARVILLEQIYRAFTMIYHEPYHK